MNFPNNIDAEKNVLGSILIDDKSIYKILYLQPEDFYDTNHQVIYQAMLVLFEERKVIDLLTLKEKGVKPRLLADLASSVVTASGIEQAAEIVKDKSLRRQLLIAQNDNEKLILDETKNIADVLANTQGNIFNIAYDIAEDDDVKTIMGEIEKVQRDYETKLEHGQEYIGISSGFAKIDKAIDGLRPSHVWTIGAYTSTGKSQFALNIINEVLKQGVPSSIISLEMSKMDTIARLVAIESNAKWEEDTVKHISATKFIKGTFPQEVFESVKDAKQTVLDYPLFVHTSYFNLDKIKMMIHQDLHQHGVKVFLIDYVQNIIGKQREYDLLTQSATDLQSLARDLNVTIVLISQVSNESEKGQGVGAGFKGSGALEAVSDLAIRLKRDKDSEPFNSIAVPVQIQIKKNRHGLTGVIDDYEMVLESGKFQPSLLKELTLAQETIQV